jgi:hypothetical protein
MSEPVAEALSVDAARIRAKMADPVWKAKNLFGFEAWSKQVEILKALRRHKRVAVRSCHGVGKTATAATAVLDFMTEGPCRVITTAPTWSQVEQLLWREIAIRHSKIPGEPFGKIFKSALEVRSDWFAMGLSTDKPERFQGHHAPRMMLVVDEASGVDEAIYEASEGFLTAEEARVLLIGNPTRPAGTFYKAFQPESGWYTVHMSAFDAPAFTGEKVSKEAERALITQEWVQDAKQQWGEDSAAYKIRVLGEFCETTGRQYFQFVDTIKPLAPKKRGFVKGVPVPGGKVEFYEDPRGAMRLWEVPDRDARYLIFADVAGSVSFEEYERRESRIGSGAGSDYSVAQVLRLDTGEQVAEIRYRSDVDEFADDLARLGRLFNDAIIAIERNGPGTAVLTQLKNAMGYPRIWRPKNPIGVYERYEQTLGWNTTSATRPLMLAALQAAIRDEPHRIKSDALKDEIKTFVYRERGGREPRPEADEGCHDDLVMAMAGAQAVWQQECLTPVRLAPRSKPKPQPDIQKRATRFVVGKS